VTASEESGADLGPADLVDGELREATVGGLSLVVACVEGRYVAFETWCSHEECPLSDGWLEGDAIRCACHGALFSLTDGAALEGPALDPIVVVGASVTADGRVIADISSALSGE
jgi:nitrite reductase/ring-hydroxylating ferredoxin subunit